MTSAGALEISIEIDDERIVASLPGTKFVSVYFRQPDGGGVLQSPATSVDQEAVTSVKEFERRAWEAVCEKARELGWMS